jgi:hypothetical protein
VEVENYIISKKIFVTTFLTLVMCFHLVAIQGPLFGLGKEA